MADTNAMAIVATEAGGLIDCPGFGLSDAGPFPAPHPQVAPAVMSYGYRYAHTASMNVSPLCEASHFSLKP
jgi:hypothetical protein